MHSPLSEGYVSPLPGFTPFVLLWQGDGAHFPSEQSARWAIRVHRLALAEAGAIALYRNSVFVKADVLQEIMSRDAVEAYKRRYAASLARHAHLLEANAA